LCHVLVFGMCEIGYRLYYYEDPEYSDLKWL